MAADRASDLGIPLAELAPATLATLKGALPENWSHGNPLDLIGDADAARYAAALDACLADPGVDGVLAILTPQAMTAPLEVARTVAASLATLRKEGNEIALDSIDEVIMVHDDDSFATCRELARREGLLVGGSSGATCYAALQVARRLGPGKRVVTIFADAAERYLSKGQL